ncbi:MAG TPA: hypothetical protein DEP85_02000 [Holosporales bacterium]|nr:MAG: hypothetical protein A3C45_00425 [Deltaproteobacteria bacterium RIFCSPHIGHO2_02_FULL_40_28]OGQ20804.1 MAG: hypothetical protein A3E27_03090 [Deltaproteobacteria bacterium RIFCSPHIGHO2_12_FULL_40_32]OGQ39205.1 MAG: hypothetical protein A3I69_04450 [Deltaproteobacteria bacterium RIFCSPLOWO2_02_FULL_40_36]OGQ54485.1 MAG: hypothetical protein A3G32_07725 [Deltaproteobacteria bacterium RIFCSPLOWO2_12_FULL_40_28]HCC24271.1 hypothetical protein [Holosporales bacterium]
MSGLNSHVIIETRSIVVSFILFAILMGCNLAQMLSMVVRPFSLKIFRRINREIANFWWALCVIFSRKINKTEIIISGDTIPEKENAIVILNHQEITDIPVLLDFALTKKRLGDLKWFVKDPIKYMPGVGWGMWFLDCLFIKRDWMKDKHSIRKVFQNLRQHQVPLWVVSFVEGTRITPKKLKSSQEYAKNKGLAVLNHVLTPRTKGFVATLEGLKGHVTAVYDLTFCYGKNIPTTWQWIRGDVKKVHLHARRFLVKQLPQSPETLSQWLLQRFVEKDYLIKTCITLDSFPA